MMSMNGMGAVVTGAAQGIGKGIASRLLREGARVAIMDLNGDGASQAAEEIGDGKNAFGIQANVTDEDQVAAAMKEAKERLGKIDLLVNNAGVLKSHFIGDFPKTDWDLVLNVNLTGAFLCIKHAAPYMIEQKSGSIVVIGSRSGKKGGLWNHAYVASKFGVIGLVQCVALDLAQHGIRANVICPGNVMETPLWDKLDKQYAEKLNMTPEQVREHYKKRVPLGRDCRVDDVANLVCFLASDQSSYMTGQAINVTGGEIMH